MSETRKAVFVVGLVVLVCWLFTVANMYFALRLIAYNYELSSTGNIGQLGFDKHGLVVLEGNTAQAISLFHLSSKLVLLYFIIVAIAFCLSWLYGKRESIIFYLKRIVNH